MCRRGMTGRRWEEDPPPEGVQQRRGLRAAARIAPPCDGAFCAAWRAPRGPDALLLKRRGRILEKTGMALLTGGALSNLSDRVLRGKVVDYFAFGSRWKKWSRLTFNLGDLCIAAGAVLALLGRPAGLPGKKKEHPSGSGNQEQTAYKG